MKKCSFFSARVYDRLSKIPKGKVTTYKSIAESLGTKAYRAVGNACKTNPFAPKIPCHRVVASDGSLGGYQGKLNNPKKRNLLKKEGVRVRNNRIAEFDKVHFSSF